MNFAFGSSKSKSQTTEKAEQDPWELTIPGLTSLIDSLTKKAGGLVGVTPDQTAAIEGQIETAKQGNPYAGQIGQLATDTLGKSLQPQVGQVNAGLDDYKRRMAPTADGANLNVGENPEVQKLLQIVGDDATNRANMQFAGAGRSFSASHLGGVAKGVSSATAPILLDQYNRETARKDAAAQGIYNASGDAARTTAGLEQLEAQLRGAGVDISKEALEAQGWGPQQIVALTEQLKSLPLSEIEQIANILFPAAQLGQQTQGTSQTKGKASKMGLSFAL